MRSQTMPWVLMGLLLTACGGNTAQDEAAGETEPAQEVATDPVAESSDSELCLDMGPQTPRDISSKAGTNSTSFKLAPAAAEMNLCNIHTHTNAEHKGPGFSVFVDDTDHGGYACNDTADLSEAELAAAPGAFGHVKSGDTIEVHWVHTSCPTATPGKGLKACVPEGCSEPLLRVEAQVFLVVNDPAALDFTTMTHGGVVNDLHQAKMLPTDTGDPVIFRGSTTGPDFTQKVCSPAKVTWSVRPQCAKLDINSLHRWAESENVFEETKSHGVRQLVTAPELLAPIE